MAFSQPGLPAALRNPSGVILPLLPVYPFRTISLLRILQWLPISSKIKSIENPPAVTVTCPFSFAKVCLLAYFIYLIFTVPALLKIAPSL